MESKVTTLVSKGYNDFLAELKHRMRHANAPRKAFTIFKEVEDR